MAKKKSETTPKTKKAGAKPAAGAGGVPQIDTAFAAEAAARSLVAGMGGPAAAGGNAGRPQESAAFKQMKAGVNKPVLGGVNSNLMGNFGGAKKSNQPAGGGKQVGRNQTFGADVNRTGVPRRTGGG